MIYFSGLLFLVTSFTLAVGSGRIEARDGRPKPKGEIARLLRMVAIWSRPSRARREKEAKNQGLWMMQTMQTRETVDILDAERHTGDVCVWQRCPLTVAGSDEAEG